MNANAIVEKLKTSHAWMSTDEATLKLEPCVFCGGEAMLVVQYPVYGISGAWARCRSCGSCGPRANINAIIQTPTVLITPLLEESLERGIAAASDAWNSRSVDRVRMGSLRLNSVPAGMQKGGKDYG